MNRRTFRFVAAAIFAIASAAFTASSVWAQNDSASPAQNPGQSASPTPAPQTPAKKVWTNDDISGLHARSGAAIPDSNAKSDVSTAKPKPTKTKDGTWYRGQILKLQAQIPPLEEKISQLQAALNGQTVTSTRQYGGAKPDDWRDELTRFQKQRDDIQTRITALEDQARHDGVPENQLP